MREGFRERHLASPARPGRIGRMEEPVNPGKAGVLRRLGKAVAGAVRAVGAAWRGEDYNGPGYLVSQADLAPAIKGQEWVLGLMREYQRRGWGKDGANQHPSPPDAARSRELGRLLEKYNPAAQGILTALRCYTLGDQGFQMAVVCR